MPEGNCVLCKEPLQLEPMEEPLPDEEPSEPMPSLVCNTAGCEMYGRTQPQSDASTFAPDAAGNSNVFQRGAPPTNEGNVPATMCRLRNGLPGFDFTQIEGPEDGADVLIKCRECKVVTEGQVVTTVNGRLEASARKAGYALSSEPATETIQRVVRTIARKTEHYAAPDTMRHRLLVIDATVDVFWTVLLGDQATVKAAAERTPWYGVVLTSPSLLIWAKGRGPRCNCSTAKAETDAAKT